MKCPDCSGELTYNSILKIMLKCKSWGSLWTGVDLAELSEPEKEKVILT